MIKIGAPTHGYGVGYLLRNCRFNFDLEDLLPQFTPPAYLAAPQENSVWGSGIATYAYLMTLGVYDKNIYVRTLKKREMLPHNLDADQKDELAIYSLLNLHERLTADGGIHIAPSKKGAGIYKVLNLPGNSAACFFDYASMGKKLNELYEENRHLWMVLPWSADELYFIDAEEVNWNRLLDEIVAEFFVEHNAKDLQAMKDPREKDNQVDYWLLPRYSAVRRLYILIDKRWQEVPPLALKCEEISQESIDDYLNYRSVSSLANYRYGNLREKYESESAELVIENLEGVNVTTARLNPDGITMLPRCDWIFYGNEMQPLCKANTLFNFVEGTETIGDVAPTCVKIPKLTESQLEDIREAGKEDVDEYLLGRMLTRKTDKWKYYPIGEAE